MLRFGCCGLAAAAVVMLCAQSHAQQQPPPTYWSHNGSILYLVADGSKREFYYEKPRAGVLEAGATQGSLLFSGKAIKENYSGKAYIFNSHCGKIPYEVSGPILDNYERVVLQGQVPDVGPDCRIRGYRKDTLEFTLVKPEEAMPPVATPEQVPVGYTFDGKCRGFPKNERVGLLVGPQQEIEKVVEGEGYAACKLIAGSLAEAKILKECSSGSPCEVDGKLRVTKNYDVEVVDLQSVKSWESWKGTCYGKVKHEGDGEFSVGVIDVQIPNKSNMPARCDFYEESVAKKILAVCPQDSICEIKARFEKKPEVSLSSGEQAYATIGFVDFVQMKVPATSVRKPEPNSYVASSPDTSKPLRLCSLAIKDPLRMMVIDSFISGGKHLGGGLTSTVKAGLERDYGSFLEIFDTATVERVDQQTGKIGCAVSYEIDLQGLAKQVLDEGATARAQILIRQTGQEGKVIRRRLQYTVQETSGGSYMAWFGLPNASPSSSSIRRRLARCALVYAGRCVVWANVF